MQLPMGTKNYSDPLGFDKSAPEALDPTAKAFEQATAELFNLNKAFLDCFSSPAGQVVLAFLKKNTIEAATWMAGLASGPGGLDAATANGFAREGQNALVRDALARMELAATAGSPEDYINKLQMKGNQNGNP